MTSDELNKALFNIEQQQRIADNAADVAARLLVGRLRHVSIWNLKKLKKELAKFNAHTGTWSDK